MFSTFTAATSSDFLAALVSSVGIHGEVSGTAVVSLGIGQRPKGGHT